jgi:serine/threonine protein kinase
MADEGLPKLPEPGHIVGGKYEIVRQIGKGGMGAVFEATHIRLRQRVAIKMLFPQAREAPGAIIRFEREARAAGQLRNPNVARIIDVENSGELPFIVMEYLEGNDLDDEIAGAGRLPIDDAVDYVLQACSAMREAHALGIVHRDLKPANLFLCRTPDGPVIKVLDFGISKITSENEGRLTSPLQTMGSPVYMSPEQLRGGRDVDERTDLWALGITLFELIAGRPPYVGTVTSTITSILSDAPPKPSDLRRGIPPGLDDVVLKALSKKPQDRYQDAESFAEALVPYASSAGVKRLRASMAAPLEPVSGREHASGRTTGERSAPTVAIRESRPYPTSTAQSWSTAPVGLVGPRRRIALILSVGVGVGVGGFLIMLLGRAPKDDYVEPAAASLATTDPPPAASGSADPKTVVESAVPPAGAAPSPGASQQWQTVPPTAAPSATPWQAVTPGAGTVVRPGLSGDTPKPPGVAGETPKPAHRSLWIPRRPAPAAAKNPEKTPDKTPEGNPLHL